MTSPTQGSELEFLDYMIDIYNQYDDPFSVLAQVHTELIKRRDYLNS